MNINAWLEARQTRGTTAALARRVVAKELDCLDVEQRFRQLYILESLIQVDGSHEAAAKRLGIHRHTIGRNLKQLGLTSTQVRELAAQIKKAEGKHGN